MPLPLARFSRLSRLSRPSLSSTRLLLQLQLALARASVVNICAALLWLAALTLWLWGLPTLDTQLQAQRHSMAQLRQSLQAPPPAPRSARGADASERLKAFYDNLGETDYAEQQVKTIFALATANGLLLDQADYRLAADSAGRFNTYQVRLPVKGPYPAVHRFCMQLLLRMPFASLDELHIRRSLATGNLVEANLQLTLYLTPARGAS